MLATIIDLCDAVIDTLREALLDQSLTITSRVGNIDVTYITRIHPLEQCWSRWIDIAKETLELVSKGDRVKIISKPTLEREGRIGSKIEGVKSIVTGTGNPIINTVYTRSIRSEKDGVIALFGTLN